MSRRADTLPAAYFDGLYSRDPDPWRFRDSAYEQAKYRHTLSMLGDRAYTSALEVGCSIGVFTRMLAPRCVRLLALDGSAVALDVARRDNADLANVQFEHGMIPDGFPSGSYDLIVLSEVLYYLVVPDVTRVARLCDRALAPGGDIILCHWLGETDYPLAGEVAADAFVASLEGTGLSHRVERRPEYRLDLLQRNAP